MDEIDRRFNDLHRENAALQKERYLLKKIIEAPHRAPGKYEKIAVAIGALVDDKNQKYGNSFNESGKIMRVLYPKGIAPEQMDDALAITRIIDKLFRIATDRDALGESPYGDIAGYSLLGKERADREKKDKSDRELARDMLSVPGKQWCSRVDPDCEHCTDDMDCAGQVMRPKKVDFDKLRPRETRTENKGEYNANWNASITQIVDARGTPPQRSCCMNHSPETPCSICGTSKPEKEWEGEEPPTYFMGIGMTHDEYDLLNVTGDYERLRKRFQMELNKKLNDVKRR